MLLNAACLFPLLQIVTGFHDVGKLQQVGFINLSPVALGSAFEEGESVLKDVFKKDMVEVLGVPQDAVDVMELCLKVDPAARPSMQQVLEMPYFHKGGELYPRDQSQYVNQSLMSTAELVQQLRSRGWKIP